MKTLTVYIVALIGVLYHVGYLFGANAQFIMESPTLTEMEFKKAMFYNRKPGGKEKIKVVYMRVPDEGTDRKWHGQAPLNPTGPPPGVFSPGTQFVQERRTGSTRSKRKTGKLPRIHSKVSRYHPHPIPPPSSSKTPCPYKLLAEDLMEQKRQQHGHPQPTPVPTEATTPSPTTTTVSTTTTQPLTTTTPLPNPYLSPSGPQMFFQQIQTDPLMALAPSQDNLLRLHQQNPMQFESLTQDLFQSQPSQFPVLMDSQPGQLLMQQQPHSSLSGGLSQIVTQVDPFTRTSSQFIVNQQPQQTLVHDPLQQFSRLTGGNQMLFDRQQQSIFGGHKQPQQQLLLLDQSHNSQVAPTTLLLPNGQLVQQQQQSPQQSLVLLNAQPEHSLSPGLSFLQQPVLKQRNNQLSLGSHSNLQLLSDINSFNGDSSSLLMNNFGRRNRKPSLPVIIQTQSSSEPESSPVVVLQQGPKKTRRPSSVSNRDRDRKRLVLISKKELEQMKHKKASRPNNVPPPPEVIHIPFHESSSGPQDEYDYEDNGQTSSNYNFPIPQTHQSGHAESTVSVALTHNSDSSLESGSDDSSSGASRDEDSSEE